MSIQVSIIEDHKPTRDSFEMLIAGAPGFECVSTHQSAEDAFENMPAEKVEVALVDVKLPKLSGIECVRRLKQQHPHLLLLMLTVIDDADKIFDALVAGAHGYILKATPPAEILAYLQEAVNGGSPMSPTIARKVTQYFYQLPKRQADLAQLTAREREILEQLAVGYSDKEIGSKLGISGHTVRGHLRNVYKKLHVAGRSAAVAKLLGR